MNSNRKVIHSCIIYLILAIGALVMLVPFAWMILTSFKTIGESTHVPAVIFPKEFQFHNYIDVTKVLHFGNYYKNTIITSVCRTFGTLLITSMAGFSFARIKFPGKNFLFMLVLSVFMIPWQCFMIPNFILMTKIHWADTLNALIVPGMFSAYGVFLLRQVFMSLPQELEDAAIIDGCNMFGVYSRIMLPLAKSGMVALGTVTFLWSWNDLLWPLVVNHSDSKLTLAVGISNMVGQFITNYPTLMAGAVMACVPMVIVFIIFQEQFVDGIALTGMK
ncbi:MAG: carbohydrate transporter rane protein 2, family [Firmicutes bacterium]|nr:carbohydrate transporter rane protein 2, family [Bacillota bacterium]